MGSRPAWRDRVPTLARLAANAIRVAKPAPPVEMVVLAPLPAPRTADLLGLEIQDRTPILPARPVTFDLSSPVIQDSEDSTSSSEDDDLPESPEQVFYTPGTSMGRPSSLKRTAAKDRRATQRVTFDLQHHVPPDVVADMRVSPFLNKIVSVI